MNRVFRPRLAAAACASILAAVAVAAPAAAVQPPPHHHEVSVTGSAECLDPRTGEWTVDWTVTSWETTARFPNRWQLREVSVAPDGVDTPELAIDQEQEMADPFTATQTLPATVSAVTLTVIAEWETRITRSGSSPETSRPDDCDGGGGPEPPEVQVDGVSECDALVVTVTNPGTEESIEATLTDGDVVETLTIEAGASAQISFEATTGTVVAVTVGDRTHELTWEQPEGCDDPGDGPPGEDGGEAGGDDDGALPLTGGSTVLFGLGALVLLGAGAGLFVLARRRRVTFTP